MPKTGHAASCLESIAESVADEGTVEAGPWFRDPAVVYRQELEIDPRAAEQTARRAVAVLAKRRPSELRPVARRNENGRSSS